MLNVRNSTQNKHFRFLYLTETDTDNIQQDTKRNCTASIIFSAFFFLIGKIENEQQQKKEQNIVA